MAEKEAEAKAPKAKVDKSKPCECGCGGKTKGGNFLPGHDARLKSALQTKAAAGDKAAVKALQERNWPMAKTKPPAAKSAGSAKKVGASA